MTINQSQMQKRGVQHLKYFAGILYDWSPLGIAWIIYCRSLPNVVKEGEGAKDIPNMQWTSYMCISAPSLAHERPLERRQVLPGVRPPHQLEAIQLQATPQDSHWSETLRL